MLTAAFREVSTFQVLRVHLAEPRSDYPQLTDHGILHSDSKILGLEPSGSTVLIIRHLYPDIEVYDWTHDRGVVIEAIEVSSGFPVRFAGNRHCTQPVTRNLSLVFVWSEITSYGSHLTGYIYAMSLHCPTPVNESSPNVTSPPVPFT